MNLEPAISRLRQTPPEQLLMQASRVLPPWVSLVFAVALAWNLGQILWLAVPTPPPGDVAPPPAGLQGPRQPSAADNTGRDLQVIVGAHLFGEFNAETAQQQQLAAPPPEEVPDTKLPLKLLGVLADSRGGGQAVIVNSQGSADVYRVSDTISGQNATVDAVFEDRVHLRRNGQIERLTLPEFDKMPARPAPVRRRTASNTRRTRSEDSQDLVQQIMDSANPAMKLSDLLRPQPVFADNKLSGYRVYPGRDRQAFAKLGLRPGDLVTQINGAALDDPSKGFEIFQQMESSVPIAVTIERGGQTQTLVLDTGSLGLGSP
jgi:general secretion pathway protein C